MHRLAITWCGAMRCGAERVRASLRTFHRIAKECPLLTRAQKQVTLHIQFTISN